MTKVLDLALAKRQIADRVLSGLKQHTTARIAVGHSGGHTLTKNWLLFQKDFAIAKDAVAKRLDIQSITDKLKQQNALSVVAVNSQANNISEYLTRPDLGRLLSLDSAKLLRDMAKQNPEIEHKDVLVAISSGLSATAIHHQAVSFLKEFVPLVDQFSWTMAPIIISEFSRVAFADKVNAILKAKMLVVLIGERPGLSSSDSMSIYFTYNSKLNSTDESRNCISNIHKHGIGHKLAAQKLAYLIDKAFQIHATGVELKDDFNPGTFNLLKDAL